jgi:hypothetical protein
MEYTKKVRTEKDHDPKYRPAAGVQRFTRAFEGTGLIEIGK